MSEKEWCERILYSVCVGQAGTPCHRLLSVTCCAPADQNLPLDSSCSPGSMFPCSLSLISGHHHFTLRFSKSSISQVYFMALVCLDKFTSHDVRFYLVTAT